MYFFQDFVFLQMAFGDASAGADGQVWTTFSQIGPFKFGIVLAVELKSAYSLTPGKAGFKDEDVNNIDE